MDHGVLIVVMSLEDILAKISLLSYKDEKKANYHLEAATIAKDRGCLLTFDFHMESKDGETYMYTKKKKNI